MIRIKSTSQAISEKRKKNQTKVYDIGSNLENYLQDDKEERKTLSSSKTVRDMYLNSIFTINIFKEGEA